jgi:DGQHR domain-containing protein
MLENVQPASELQGLAAKRLRREIAAKHVAQTDWESRAWPGWVLDRRVGKKLRIVRPKARGAMLEDRVWSLLYRMGFPLLSGENGARLAVDPKDPASPKVQLDVVGVDGEVGVAIECKSAETVGRKADFDRDIAKHAVHHTRFTQAINALFPQDPKRVGVMAIFTSNIVVSDSERAKAAADKVVLLNERDLDYYEKLVNHLGPAARYQFFADLLPGRPIPGLEINVPAIKGKMGGFNCYTFSISPERLLKIAYVSHHTRNQAADDTYQRMVAKTRLKNIRHYISKKENFFPTNVVITLERGRHGVRFHQTTQEGDEGNGVLGWLRIKPAYGAAWVIDGQHRLFAYSGHPMASRSLLSVIAFEGLPPAQQSRLFVDINHEQKSVKRSHLYELFSKLRRGAADPSERIDAIVSEAIMALDSDPSSPFHGRIQKTDDTRTATRCLSVQTLFSALFKPGMYIASKRKDDGSILAYGALWAGDSSEMTVRRTTRLLNAWFAPIRDSSLGWWDLGCAEGGGGLAMNNSVTACINVLRSVFQHLADHRVSPITLDDDALASATAPFADALGEYLGRLSPEERAGWRKHQGVTGQTTLTRRCQEAIHGQFPEFNPAGLAEYIEIVQAQTNARAKDIIDRSETLLQRVVVRVLKTKLGDSESGWWMKGVPVEVRKKATQRREDDGGQRGGAERYFDLIDYRTIIQANWLMFQDLFGYGKANLSKDRRTQWIVDLNERRRVVMHASSGQYVSVPQLAELEQYGAWLAAQLADELGQ